MTSTESSSSQSDPTTVAISLDGVIANWVKGLRAHVAARQGVADRQLAMNVSWDMSEWGVTDPRATVSDFLMSPMMERLTLVDGVESGLAQLHGAGLSVLVLSRRVSMVGADPSDQAHVRDATRRWFASRPELGIGAGDIMFTDDPVATDADVWVDDAPVRVERLVAANKPVWLLPQPWNRSVRQLSGASILYEGWDSAHELVASLNSGS